MHMPPTQVNIPARQAGAPPPGASAPGKEGATLESGNMSSESDMGQTGTCF
jgi:hypothetical protein